MKITFNFRYMVIGLYVDRTRKIVRVYPCPFIRISFNEKPLAKPEWF